MEWENGYRLGLDGLNENVHNNWFNILARGGLIQVLLFFGFYYFLFKKKSYSGITDLLLLVLPLLFVSFFDSSMENAHFPILYYFFLGREYILKD